MANYQAIIRLRPEVRDFIRHRRWVHRGDVIAYGPNIACDSFSTDGAGFRHSTFRGDTLSVHDCLQRERYGVILGSSHVYGFGLSDNRRTFASRLAERFDFPFANVCMPEASSRNLFAQLAAFIARAPAPPAIVVLMTGGDFTGFCFTRIADPVFGSPNLNQMAMVRKERGEPADPTREFARMLASTSLWTRAIAQICADNRIPLILGDDTTFFEKVAPSTADAEVGLGQPFNAAQALQFETHRHFFPQFLTQRAKVADTLKLPLAGPGFHNEFGFVDEFHYDDSGTAAFAATLSAAIDPLLSA